MGTLCKNCPFKHTNKEEGHCTDLFIKKFHNSCVTFDIKEDLFFKDLDEFCKKKKVEKQTAPISEKVIEIPSTVVENKTTKKARKGTKKATAKKPIKSTVKITQETKTEENE